MLLEFDSNSDLIKETLFQGHPKVPPAMQNASQKSLGRGYKNKKVRGK